MVHGDEGRGIWEGSPDGTGLVSGNGINQYMMKSIFLIERRGIAYSLWEEDGMEKGMVWEEEALEGGRRSSYSLFGTGTAWFDLGFLDRVTYSSS